MGLSPLHGGALLKFCLETDFEGGGASSLLPTECKNSAFQLRFFQVIVNNKGRLKVLQKSHQRVGMLMSQEYSLAQSRVTETQKIATSLRHLLIGKPQERDRKS